MLYLLQIFGRVVQLRMRHSHGRQQLQLFIVRNKFRENIVCCVIGRIIIEHIMGVFNCVVQLLVADALQPRKANSQVQRIRYQVKRNMINILMVNLCDTQIESHGFQEVLNSSSVSKKKRQIPNINMDIMYFQDLYPGFIFFFNGESMDLKNQIVII